MNEPLIFPVAVFQNAREQMVGLCKALAYAATDPDGSAFVCAFLLAVEARRLLTEAQLSVREQVE